MIHEEYGQGFIDGFNAALKSEYIKEKYQSEDHARLIARIKELEAQNDQIRAAIISTYNYYQSMSTLQYQSTGLASIVNAYPFMNRSII